MSTDAITPVAPANCPSPPSTLRITAPCRLPSAVARPRKPLPTVLNRSPCPPEPNVIVPASWNTDSPVNATSDSSVASCPTSARWIAVKPVCVDSRAGGPAARCGQRHQNRAVHAGPGRCTVEAQGVDETFHRSLFNLSRWFASKVAGPNVTRTQNRAGVGTRVLRSWPWCGGTWEFEVADLRIDDAQLIRVGECVHRALLAAA